MEKSVPTSMETAATKVGVVDERAEVKKEASIDSAVVVTNITGVTTASNTQATISSSLNDNQSISSRSFGNQDLWESGSKRQVWVLGAVVTIASAVLRFYDSHSLHTSLMKTAPQQQQRREEQRRTSSFMQTMGPTREASYGTKKQSSLARNDALKKEAPGTDSTFASSSGETRDAVIRGKSSVQVPSINVKNGVDLKEKKIIVYKKPLGESPVTFGYTEKNMAKRDDKTGISVQVAAGAAAVGVASSAIGSIEIPPKLPSFPTPAHLQDLINDSKSFNKRQPSSGPSAEAPQFVETQESKKGRLQGALDKLRYGIAYGIESHMPDVILAVLFWDVGFLLFGFVNKLLGR